MSLTFNLYKTLNWFSHSVWFFKNHFLTIFTLGLVAAFGRAIQLGAFGEITTQSHIFLEIIVELTRLLIFFYTLGLTHIKTGAGRVVKLFTNKASRRKNWHLAMQQLKSKWAVILLNLVTFLFIAWIINYLIDYAAYQTCMYAKLKAGQIISDEASEWALILFFKNISVIPFTIIFNAFFLLWITNKLTASVSYRKTN